MPAPSRTTSTAFIGLGSNLDHPLQQVERAVERLQQLPDSQLVAVSPWYGSTPVGGESGQPDYVNGVAQLTTKLPPLALLHALQAIEHAQGRRRTTHWGARTLDLDLLLYDQQIITSLDLTIPHPRLHQRAFVLLPLADLAADLTLPNGAGIRSLLASTNTTGTWPLGVVPAMPHSPIHPTSQDRGTHDHG